MGYLTLTMLALTLNTFVYGSPIPQLLEGRRPKLDISFDPTVFSDSTTSGSLSARYIGRHFSEGLPETGSTPSTAFQSLGNGPHDHWMVGGQDSELTAAGILGLVSLAHKEADLHADGPLSNRVSQSIEKRGLVDGTTSRGIKRRADIGTVVRNTLAGALGWAVGAVVAQEGIVNRLVTPPP